MLKNYIKIAWKVLLRRKFFTFISLFGISLTLMVLMVLTAFINHLVSPNYPEVHNDRTLYISGFILKNQEIGSMWSGAVGFPVIEKYIKEMETPEKIGFSSLAPNKVNAYAGTNRLELFQKYTDANFWEITQFNFIEGTPYNQQHIRDGAKVAVINEDTRDGYFGKDQEVQGSYIEVGADKYRVIGVVESVPMTRLHSAADIYLPYASSESILKEKNVVGDFGVMLLAESSADFDKIQAEYQSILSKVEKPDPYDEIVSNAMDYADGITRGIFHFETEINPLYLITGIFAFLFMLLPTINLVNLNVTRIMERSSEIGVRKAFGASSSRLVGQFLVENLIITLIGGVIGISLAALVIYWLNNSGLIAHLDLKINLTVMGVSLVVCLIFGLLSGVLPAFRMSRMHVVNALKGGEV